MGNDTAPDKVIVVRKNFARFVYGPVVSQRLGQSLEIAPVPFKTCSYGCVYCRFGRTTCQTVTSTGIVPVDYLLGELARHLSSGIPPDFITVSGAGEPTLYSGLGALITGIKKCTRIPVAVMTNGSLLWRKEVREALSAADLVIASLGAGDEFLFQYVHRPHPSLSLEAVVAGIERFRTDFGGQLWLEVILLAGVTTVTADLAKIRDVVERIRPHRLQLSTVGGPPSETYAYPVPSVQLERYARLLGDHVEVLGPRPPMGAKSRSGPTGAPLPASEAVSHDSQVSDRCHRPGRSLTHDPSRRPVKSTPNPAA